MFGDVYVKVRRDNKGMPFAFCQYEVSSLSFILISMTQGTKWWTECIRRSTSNHSRPRRTSWRSPLSDWSRKSESWAFLGNKQTHHREANQSLGSLYLSKVTGGTISESEAHQALSRFGALEKVWYCSQTEKEMFRLPEGIWIMFAFFQDCRDAQAVRVLCLGYIRRSSCEN